ncbi:hypothetical protein BDV96DRAFT_582847 [Lophiotrema nucula]|uniref:Uncharacterized protein n=1 Tax=Lophiotrema nucula TaxID=690887 RepID=A0A6A5YVP5_9PLEO|nr:hypothetical protein BDV96DRAFT_582847 [Lophiotrema nucula]
MSFLQTYPQTLSDAELENLYHKAVKDPASLSRSEKNAIKSAPPPDVEDALCVQHCGLTMEALFAKGLADPMSLTEAEASIICVGANLPTSEAIKLKRQERDRRPSWFNDLMWEALQAITTPESMQVRKGAYEKYRVWRRRHMAGKRLWIRMLEQQFNTGEADKWGFALFRTGFEERDGWKTLRKVIHERAMSMIRTVGAQDIADRFAIHYVENDNLSGAGGKELRQHFTTLRDKIPKGIRTDLFLSADNAVIAQAERGQPCVLLWDADFHDEGGEASREGHDEQSTSSIERLISPMYAEIMERRSPRVSYNQGIGS